MSQRIDLVVEMIKAIKPGNDFVMERDLILDELKKVKSEQEKTTFRYLRSTKEKNILSSLLTRTSKDLKQLSDRLIIRAEELQRAKELAEAGTQAKNEFIASISHEFRTPMNGILGLSDMLKNTSLNNEQQVLLNGIISSAENLLVLLNDVLDFSAIEAGKMKLDYQPFMLDRVLEDISIMMKMKAREKSLKFSVNIRPDVPNSIVGDAQRLRQILINLANNSIKFTEKGSINIRVSLVERDSLQATLRFVVSDTGIGIPQQAMDSLFKVFSRVKQDKTKLVSGTGLGLSICKKLTDLMGGEIGVESVVGQGSAFWFTLPFVLSTVTPVSEIADPFTHSIKFSGRRVLVAEDNQINQMVVDFQLQKMGFEVEMVANGQDALELYSKKSYDLILLDIQMPLLDGFEVAKKIRELESLSGLHLPIIALTANAMKGDREEYLAAGMDEYVSKPFTHESLFGAISKLLE